MKKTMPLIIAVLIVTSFSTAHAELKTFIKEYTYQASEDDSRNSSRTIALRQVKRLLLEELGTYLESVTEVKDFKLTKDQITTLTAGIVKTEIVEETWDGRTYWLKSKIAADSVDVIRAIDALRTDRVKTKELEEVRKRSDALLKENERLRNQLAAINGGKRQKKEEAYNKTIKEMTVIDWFEKGYSSGISGNYVDAIESFGKVIEINPKSAKAYMNRGVAYDALGNQNLAIEDFNKAIRLNPKDAMAYRNRGLAYSKLNKIKQAMADVNRAVELDPQDARAYYDRGMYYSILVFEEAEKMNPKYLKRIESYVHKELPRAIKDFDKSLELDPLKAETYVTRAEIYFILDDYHRTIKDLNKAIEINPRLAGAYQQRALAYAKLGYAIQALKDSQAAARLGDKKAQDSLRGSGIAW